MQCQLAANHNWDIYHIDLKTAFLQGESFDQHRDVVCQIPPEAGYPPYMAARLKRAAYGLNDAPRLWWNKLDKALRSYSLKPTRADRCCYVLYSDKKKTSVASSGSDGTSHAANDSTIWEAKSFSGDSSLSAAIARVQRSAKSENRDLDLEGALDMLLDPIYGSAATDKKVEGVLCIHVDDAFMTGTDFFKTKVVEALRRDFKVGSEDVNDVAFVGQRIRWIDRENPSKRHIRVDQETKVEEMAEIIFDKTLGDEVVCTKDLHTQYRSLLGQINWLQSRTQYQACYAFSRRAAAAAAPTIADVKLLNKLCRTIRSEVVVLRYWPLEMTDLRIVGYPDASYRNNKPDKSSQRGQAIFIACLLYTSPSPRDKRQSRMPSSA